MDIDIIGIIDSERDEILKEITDCVFEWNWTMFGGIEVSGGKYSMEGFTMWLDRMDVIWCHK